MLSSILRKYAVFVVMSLLMVLALSCGTPTATVAPAACPSGSPSLTQGCDEFSAVDSTVYHNNTGVTQLNWWSPFATGESLSTDASGQAKLNLSSCYPDSVYIFGNTSSTFNTSFCSKQELQSGLNSCVDYGTTYNSCSGEFTVYTSSAKIVKNGTVFSVTYLPEHDLTLVVLLDGAAELLPVVSFGPVQYGSPVEIGAGQFAFVTPEGKVGGLEAGTPYSLDQLPALAAALNIGDWMRDVGAQGKNDNVLPPAWPAEFGGTSAPYVVTLQGGALADPGVQSAFAYGVDWKTAFSQQAAGGQSVSAIINGQQFNALADFSYDPLKAQSILSDTAYKGGGFEVSLVYPEEEPQLQDAANVILDNLQVLGIKVAIRPTPGASLKDFVTTLAAAGEAVMAIGH
jgi:extracellular solute-binding protein (family 5)